MITRSILFTSLASFLLLVASAPAQAQFKDPSNIYTPEAIEYFKRKARYELKPKTPQDLAGTWVAAPGGEIFERAQKIRTRYAFSANGKYRKQLNLTYPLNCGAQMVENEFGTYTIDNRSKRIDFNIISRETTWTNPCDPRSPKTTRIQDSRDSSALKLELIGPNLTKRRLCLGAGNCYSPVQ